MRLLHVLAETGYSGGEGQLNLILQHFAARGHRNTVILHPGAKFADTARELGADVRFLPLRRWWRPDLYPRLRAAIVAADADILHFACGKALHIGGLAAIGRTARVKVTIRRIDYPIRRGLLGGFRYRRLVDHTVAICDAIAERLRAAGVDAANITRIYDGIDPAPWLPLPRQRAAARQRLAIPADAQLIVCAAVLRPRKGQRVLIDAFARLAPAHPRARLFLAGDGSELVALRQHAQRLGLQDRVALPGAVRPIHDVLAAADVFCMPSFHEGLCNACLEAGFAGLPQVVSDAGGNGEIVVDGQTGAVVRAGDVAALADAIAPYLSDDSLARQHGEAGRERCLRLFTAARLGPELEELFVRLLADRPRARPNG